MSSICFRQLDVNQVIICQTSAVNIKISLYHYAMTTTIDITNQMDFVNQDKTDQLIIFLESLHLYVHGDNDMRLRNLNDDSTILIENLNQLNEYIDHFRQSRS